MNTMSGKAEKQLPLTSESPAAANDDHIEIGDATGGLRSETMKPVQLTLDTVERQEIYIKAQEQRGEGLGLLFADAFIRGMRDIGYKSPAWALAELIDNSIQAGATAVDMRLAFKGDAGPNAKPDELAIIDNGAGMIPMMISYAVRWGGTDRENDRNGFGRYGYGLPSAAVSLAKRYTVYSKTAGSRWHAVTVDLRELAKTSGDVKATDKLIQPRRADPPSWLLEAAINQHQLNVGTMDSGTIIVLDDLDRLRVCRGWSTRGYLENKLLGAFGVIYRHWVVEKRLMVNGLTVEAVDPLFLMPGARLVDETPVKAKPVYQHAFEMQSDSGETGVVRIRAALLPPNFQLADPAEYSGDNRGKRTNRRHSIMKEYNGLLVCREGRQIDCISPEWTKFQNYDYNLKIEVDFDPVLDEFFGITTSKQQIVIDDRMWEKLKQSGKESGGLQALVRDMRDEFEVMQAQLKRDREKNAAPEDTRPSEQAMMDAEKFRVRRPVPTPQKVTNARNNLDEEVNKTARERGESPEAVRPQVEAETSKHPWRVDFEYIEDGPFYIPKRMGLQKRIIINTAHPFFEKVYDQAQGIKSALEVVLFVLADGELDAEGDRETFYRTERVHQWSATLRHALDKLVDDEAIVNRVSLAREREEADGAAAH